jgi:hypothetical protein
MFVENNGSFTVNPKTTLYITAVNGAGNSEVHGASMVMENETIAQTPPPTLILDDGVTLKVQDKFTQNNGNFSINRGSYGNKVKLDTAEFDFSTGALAIGNNGFPDVFEVTGKMDWGDANSTGLAKVVVGWDATTSGNCSKLQLDGDMAMQPYVLWTGKGAAFEWDEDGSMPSNNGGMNKVTYTYTFLTIGGAYTQNQGTEAQINNSNNQDQNRFSDDLNNTDLTKTWVMTAKNF